MWYCIQELISCVMSVVTASEQVDEVVCKSCRINVESVHSIQQGSHVGVHVTFTLY